MYRVLLLVLAGCASSAAEEVGGEDCAACHGGPTAGWEASRHASSATNPHIVAALEGARHESWCRTCHEPEPTGVGCRTCHPTHGPTSPDVCEGCHQFAAPAMTGPLALGGDPIQDTVREHRASPAAREGQTCASCHLKGHRFPGAHDPELVRSALTVRAEPGALVLQTTDALGHRLPTGDPFRRLEIRLCADVPCTDVRVRRSAVVVHQPDADGWLRVVSDTRLGPPGSGSDTLEVPWADGVRGWDVRLLLADPALDVRGSEAVTPLFEGARP